VTKQYKSVFQSLPRLSVLHLLLNAMLLLGAAARRCQSISPARTVLSSKPTECRCCCRSTGQTNGRIDARPFHRPAAHTMRAVSTMVTQHELAMRVNYLFRSCVVRADGDTLSFVRGMIGVGTSGGVSRRRAACSDDTVPSARRRYNTATVDIDRRLPVAAADACGQCDPVSRIPLCACAIHD